LYVARAGRGRAPAVMPSPPSPPMTLGNRRALGVDNDATDMLHRANERQATRAFTDMVGHPTCFFSSQVLVANAQSSMSET
jgi:hypothetical protein